MIFTMASPQEPLAAPASAGATTMMSFVRKPAGRRTGGPPLGGQRAPTVRCDGVAIASWPLAEAIASEASRAACRSVV